MKKKLIILTNFSLTLLGQLVLARTALAGNFISKNLDEVSQGIFKISGNPKNELLATAGLLVKTFLSLLGVIFIGLIIYAGYNWMTAGGDEAKVTKAKDTIRYAIIGLIIIIGSYSIWDFIFNKLA